MNKGVFTTKSVVTILAISLKIQINERKLISVRTACISSVKFVEFSVFISSQVPFANLLLILFQNFFYVL